MRDKVFFSNIKRIMQLKESGKLTKPKTVNPADIELFSAKNDATTQYYNFHTNSSDLEEGNISPERRKELENWKLDWELYVNTEDIDTEIKQCDYHFEHKKEILDIYNGWYQTYLAQHNGEEMNYLTAVQYLKDNPNEDESIKEFIKKSFGICDGNISKNQQMGKGLCHLLSCRAELDDSDDPEIQEIARNIVVQNEDGTVTVTFAGIRDESGKPLQFIVKNEEIKDSYTKFDASTVFRGGSTDPDDAALEIGYQKLKEFLIKNYPMDYGSKLEDIENKLEDLKDEKWELYDKSDKILESAYKKTYFKLMSQLAKSDKVEDKELLSYIMENTDANEDNSLKIYRLMTDKKAYDTIVTYDLFDEKFKCNITTTNSLKSLYKDKVIELLQSEPEYKELSKQYNETEEKLDIIYDNEKKFQSIKSNLVVLKALYDQKETGSRAKLTFKLLTGKGKYIKELGFEEMKQYLNDNKDNLEKIPIETSKYSYNHEFMFDRPIINKKTGRIEEIVISNPHNTGAAEDDTLYTTSGNYENTFSVAYYNFLNDFNITIIGKEPDETKEDYFQLPFNYETY